MSCLRNECRLRHLLNAPGIPSLPFICRRLPTTLATQYTRRAIALDIHKYQLLPACAEKLKQAKEQCHRHRHTAHRMRHLTQAGVCRRFGGGRGLVLAPAAAAAAAPGQERERPTEFHPGKRQMWRRRRRTSTKNSRPSRQSSPQNSSVAKLICRKTQGSCRVTTALVTPGPYTSWMNSLTPSDQSTRSAGDGEPLT